MHAKRRAPDVCCTLQAFDCKWCGVVLNVSPRLKSWNSQRWRLAELSTR